MKQRVRAPKAQQQVEFYEMMQANMSTPYVPTYEAVPAQEQSEVGVPVGRTTAIITLVSLVVAAGLLAFIVITGLRAALS